MCVAWALEDTSHFTLGLSADQLTVETDHKPLLGVFSKDASEFKFNRRIMNLKKKCESWQFQITHIPGKETKGPDCLSRYPQNNNIKVEINPVHLDDIIKGQEEDSNIQELKRCLKKEKNTKNCQIHSKNTEQERKTYR